ncbi:MAG: fibronectin type III domain-containing protein [Anaerolineae bacterium]|nr:fibronectin type III domain-containing protein [Anaerolineae bacterium]
MDRLPEQSEVRERYGGESALDLVSALRTLVDPNGITAQADRLLEATAALDDCMPSDEEPPDDIRFPALDAILMGAVDPVIARVVGLYHVDKEALEGHIYDYKVEGTWPPGTLWKLSNMLTFDDYPPGQKLDFNIIPRSHRVGRYVRVYPPGQRLDLNIFTIGELAFQAAIRPTVLERSSETAGTNCALAFLETDSFDWNLPPLGNLPIDRLESAVEIRFPQPVGEVQIHLGQQTSNVVLEAWDDDRSRRVDVMSGNILSVYVEQNDRIVASVVLKDLEEPALRNLFVGKRLVQRDDQGNERAFRILESSVDTPWASGKKVSLVLFRPYYSTADPLCGGECTIEPSPSTRREDVLAVHGYLSTDQITRVVLKGTGFWLYKICWQVERIPHGTYCAFAHGLQVKDADPLKPPTNVNAVALPGLARKDADCRPLNEGETSGTRYSAGVSWKLPLSKNRLLPKSAVRYQVGRQSEDGRVKLLTKEAPVMVTELDSERLATWIENRPEGWPEKPPHFIDSGLEPGRYRYWVAGVDIFGRISVPSKASGWVEVKPPAPPPPANLVARFVDRRDPWLDKLDLEALVEGVDEAFRLRWRWPDEYDQLAPDIHGFHIYYSPGIPNVLQGKVTKVDSESSGRISVTADLDGLDNPPENLLAGRLLSQGGKAFRILSHKASAGDGSVCTMTAILRLPDEPSENRPAKGACSIALEATVPVEVMGLDVHDDGFKATIKSTSLGALPSSGLQGGSLVILGVEAGLDGANLDTAASDHIEMTVWGSLLDPTQRDQLLDRVVPFDARLRLPPPDTTAYRDYSQLDAWPVTIGGTIPKTILGEYNLAIRKPVGEESIGLTSTGTGKYVLVVNDSYPDLDANSDTPIREGFFGVSSEGLGGQGPVSTPAGVLRVFRGDAAEQAAVVAKLQPLIAAEKDFVLKGPPNFAGKLTYEFSWPAREEEGWRYEVFRTLDETLFSVDRAVRKEAGKTSPHFLDEEGLPDEEAKQAWLNSFPESPAALRPAIESLVVEPTTLDLAAIEHHLLCNSLLQALASLPYNDRAFTRLNLDSNHLKLDGDSPNRMVCIDDTIEGRAVGRYFYRVQAYDSVSNAAPMAMASQPIYVRGDLRPAAPVITAVDGGDRQIVIRWETPQDPRIKGYILYRTDDPAKTVDPRRMDPITPDPWLSELEHTDPTVEPGKRYYYAVRAVGDERTISGVSGIRSVAAYDYESPNEPTWLQAEWTTDGGQQVVRLAWRADAPSVTCILQRSLLGGTYWRAVSPRLASTSPTFDFEFLDRSVEPGTSYQYRVIALDIAGNKSSVFNVRAAPAEDD